MLESASVLIAVRSAAGLDCVPLPEKGDKIKKMKGGAVVQGAKFTCQTNKQQSNKQFSQSACNDRVIKYLCHWESHRLQEKRVSEMGGDE